MQLSTPVRIFKAHDIILAEVSAGLYLNDFQRHFAGILQPMARAQRYVGRLVFRQQQRFVATRYARRALDHDPVLSAMVMHLQRQ